MRSTVFGAVLALAVPSLASAQDQSTSDFPWVSFVAGSSGTYMINFTMCDCATDICHMAMQVMN